jgi:hypothetical protein
MDARDILPAHMIEFDNDKLAENSQSYRLSGLFILALECAKSGSRSDQTYEAALAGLLQLETDDSVLSEKCSCSAAQGSDVQGMSAAATYDATLAAQERRTEAEAPGPKCKIVQHHTQAKGRITIDVYVPKRVGWLFCTYPKEGSK